MKDMEIKTENRYEYRKTQEKRKQMIAPDLFEFAYVPDWYGHLAELERLALPESWRFRHFMIFKKNDAIATKFCAVFYFHFCANPR